MITYELRNDIEKVIGIWQKDGFIPPETVIPKYSIEQPPSNIKSDLATNLPMVLSKILRISPKDIAEKFISMFPANLELYVKLEFTPPGFLNFHISPQRWHEELSDIIQNSEKYGQIQKSITEPEKILIEYVSANPTGPLHIGHGRGAAIGDSLSRICKHLGFFTQTEYYINDRGNQMYNLGNSTKLRCIELLTGSITEEDKQWLQTSGYRGEYIKDTAQLILNETGWKTETEARDTPVDPFFIQKASSYILETIKNELISFRVNIENWFSESTLYTTNQVEQSIEKLKTRGYIYEKDGALWFDSEQFGDDKPRVIYRSEGKNPLDKYTYLAPDIAYHENKFQRGFNKLINIWGADHHGYVVRLKAAVQALGHNPENLIIILCQLVRLLRDKKPVVMSTRAAEFVTLNEVITEVGVDATRYFLVLRTPDAQLDFDLDLAKKQSLENPVYYVQYAHTRISGILREAAKQINDNTNANYTLLKEDAELDLIKKMAFFSKTLLACKQDLSPHHLTIYLLELAGKFHRYYDKYRVLTEDLALTRSRMHLIQAIATVIRTGLSLLGVSAPERM